MTKFYLVRHAQPDWSVADAKRLRGLQLEFCPLSRDGIMQARQLATNSILENAELIISSPYTRALQTAAILSAGLELPLMVEYDLHERIPDDGLQYTREEIFGPIKKDFERYNGEYHLGEKKKVELAI